MDDGLIAVVGATGFVGRHVCDQLEREGRPFRALGRRPRPAYLPSGCYHEIPALPASPARLSPAFAGAVSVIHLAARVHAMDGDSPELLPRYRRDNVEAARAVAQAALAQGVRRFVYVSTIKVHGDRTVAAPYRATDPLFPDGAYAASKVETEAMLQKLFADKPQALTIVRPPLVYGPGVTANFRQLVRLVDRGVPLPFGAVRNRRSLVGVRNLSDLLVRASQQDQGRVLLVSDGEPVSTSDLVREIAAALGRKPRLLSLPPSLMLGAAAALGRKAMAQRLLCSLEVDMTATEAALGWRPPFSLQDELRRLAAALRSTDGAGRGR